MKIFRSRIVFIAALLVAWLGLTSCLKGGTIQSITVSPVSTTMATGASQQFIATANFSDGTTLNWTSAVEWSSSDTAVALVSNTTGSNGIVTAVAAGPTIITAIDLTNNLSGNATLAVSTIPSITVTPANASMASGTTQQFTATLAFTPGTVLDLTTLVFWSSSNTAVATVSNTTGSNGIVTAVAAGTTTITATDLITNITGTTTLTVN